MSQDYEGYLEDWQKLGADYAMYGVQSKQIRSVKALDWNCSRIQFINTRVEHWLNGELLIQFTPWSEDWYERKRSGKLEKFPEYGISSKGLVGIQDHGSRVWFRNIRIRKL